jgi:hypothetical protein
MHSSPRLLPRQKMPLVISQSQVTLRLAVYRQSVCLGVKLLETHDQRFFQLKPCVHSPYVTSSLSLSLILRSMVSRQVCLGIKHPSGAYDQILITVSCGFVEAGRSL